MFSITITIDYFRHPIQCILVYSFYIWFFYAIYTFIVNYQNYYQFFCFLTVVLRYILLCIVLFFYKCFSLKESQLMAKKLHQPLKLLVRSIIYLVPIRKYGLNPCILRNEYFFAKGEILFDYHRLVLQIMRKNLLLNLQLQLQHLIKE